MRILIRTSRWAIWARRLGGIAVPLLVIPILMHRERYIDSAVFLPLAVFAGAVAVLAVLIAVGALVRLWSSGDQGWGRALTGLCLGLVCLAPYIWYGQLALRYPVVTDIATTSRSDLPLIFEPDTAIMPQPRLLTPDQQQRFFPNATTRDYPLDSIQLFALVDRIVRANGWDVRLRTEPLDVFQQGRINARIVTLPGWREEVVLRVSLVNAGAMVDMRSASIGAPLDFGSNGNRISDFMITLDNEVTAFLRDNPNINAPAPAEVQEPAPEVDTGNGN